ncbi:glycosyltransferase family 2 protein [Helicobacter pametensis]|uniref:glycosyltransferase family 2 protein n=1 Tax=Helicobacter pametensis TaxID=95149 RepID=UPI0004851D3C|nr:glycosyltransferase family 2 protein [Helicobacter pametensis]
MKCAKTPFFSVILPIYNREKYLEDTLKSLAHQTFQDFEVIAIDDGSDDQSIAIMQNSAHLFANLTLIQQTRLGVSEARNAGLRKAQGQYICFLDSDDLLHPSYLEDFYQVVCQTSADIIKNASTIKFSDYPKTKTSYPICNIKQMSFNQDNIKLGGTIWSYCICNQFLQSIQLTFLPKRIMEDEAFILMALPLSSKTIFFEGSPYLYRQHSQSIVATTPIPFDRLTNFKDIIAWYRAHDVIHSFPVPFYILYDIGIKNTQYSQYLQKAQKILQELELESYLDQNHLAYTLRYQTIQTFIYEHQKSRGKLKYYLRRLFHLL